jgi:hypothetical protein
VNETKNAALIEALESADWSGVNLGTKALIQSAINALAGTNGAQAGPVIELSRVEQMAAYYEAPQAFFEWLDLMRSAHDEEDSVGTQPISPCLLCSNALGQGPG